MNLVKISMDASVGNKAVYSILYGFLKNFTSEQTIKAYSKDLRDYFKYLKEDMGSVVVTAVNHNDIISYRDLLLETNSKRTVVRKLATLQSFYKFLVEQELIEHNPVSRVKRPKFSSGIKTQDLSDEELEQSYNAFDRDRPSGKLHYILWLMFFKTGLRHDAIADLKFKDLSEVGDLLCFEHKIKGGETDIKPMSEEMVDALGDYLNWCKENGYSMDNDDYIFRPTMNRYGGTNKKLQPSSIRYIFKKIQKDLGIKGSISPHSARATAIGRLLDSGESLYKVAEFVNHKDPKTTQGYSKRKTKLKDSLLFKL